MFCSDFSLPSGDDIDLNFGAFPICWVNFDAIDQGWLTMSSELRQELSSAVVPSVISSEAISDVVIYPAANAGSTDKVIQGHEIITARFSSR